MKETTTKQEQGIDANTNQITRKEAISKMGKYAGLLALGTFSILSPAQSQIGSPQDPTNIGFGGSSRSSNSRPTRATRD